MKEKKKTKIDSPLNSTTLFIVFIFMFLRKHKNRPCVFLPCNSYLYFLCNNLSVKLAKILCAHVNLCISTNKHDNLMKELSCVGVTLYPHPKTHLNDQNSIFWLLFWPKERLCQLFPGSRSPFIASVFVLFLVFLLSHWCSPNPVVFGFVFFFGFRKDISSSLPCWWAACMSPFSLLVLCKTLQQTSRGETGESLTTVACGGT